MERDGPPGTAGLGPLGAREPPLAPPRSRPCLLPLSGGRNVVACPVCGPRSHRLLGLGDPPAPTPPTPRQPRRRGRGPQPGAEHRAAAAGPADLVGGGGAGGGGRGGEAATAGADVLLPYLNTS